MRDSTWLIKMILHGNALIQSDDTLATQLFYEYHHISHPDFQKLEKNGLNELIDFLKIEGQRPMIVPQ